jgi:hypothetical protein
MLIATLQVADTSHGRYPQPIEQAQPRQTREQADADQQQGHHQYRGTEMAKLRNHPTVGDFAEYTATPHGQQCRVRIQIQTRKSAAHAK